MCAWPRGARSAGKDAQASRPALLFPGSRRRLNHYPAEGLCFMQQPCPSGLLEVWCPGSETQNFWVPTLALRHHVLSAEAGRSWDSK